MNKKVMSVENTKGEVQGYCFYCPGCKHHHMYYTVSQHPGAPVWSFNGNMQKPTFRASLLVNKDLSCPNEPRCHIFVTDGNIQFLGDCTHELARQTLEMEDIPED